MSVPNLVKVALHWSGYGEEGTFSAHYTVASLGTETDAQDVLGVADVNMDTETTPSAWTQLQDLITASQSFDDLAFYGYPSAPGPASIVAHRSPSPSRPGLGIIQAGLEQAVVASVETGFSSRRRRGRAYLPGHCVPVGSDAQLSAANVLVMRDAYIGFAASVLDALRASTVYGDTARHVVFSPTGGISTESTSIVVDSRVDTQRRRSASQKPLRVSAAGHINPTS